MFDNFVHWFREGNNPEENSKARQPSRTKRRRAGRERGSRDIRFEMLEDRQLLSGGPVGGLLSLPPMLGSAAQMGTHNTASVSTTQATTTTALAVSNATPGYGQLRPPPPRNPTPEALV